MESRPSRGRRVEAEGDMRSSQNAQSQEMRSRREQGGERAEDQTKCTVSACGKAFNTISKGLTQEGSRTDYLGLISGG